MRRISLVLTAVMQAVIDRKNELNLPVAKGDDAEEAVDESSEEEDEELSHQR
jgi:hypothetical protein